MTRTTKIIGMLIVVLVLLLISTEPTKLPSAMLIVPFVLLFAILSLAISVLVRRYGVRTGKSVRVGVMASTLPTLLLVMQSLGQLTPRDTFTILALFGITYFYISRVTRPSSE
jgi:hypothetical protein